MQYYFLASRLPELEIGQQPEITWEEFLFLLENNLTKRDLHWVRVLRFCYDVLNIRHFWLGEDLDPRGNLNVGELEEAFVKEDGFPSYVSAYLEKYSHQEERLRHFSSLLSSYFRQHYPGAPPFLNDYLKFERELRLVLMGFRAKILHRDLAMELQDEDPDDPLVEQLMAQKDAKAFEPPEGFEDLKGIFQQHSSDPMELYQALTNYRFRWIEERLLAETFSIDRILGYMIQLILALQWLELDQEKGQKLIDTMVKEAL